MSRTRTRSIVLFFIATLLTSAIPSSAYGQLGHRVLRDWTFGVEARRSANDGYNSDFRRIGLTEYEGDVTGTYISWGFGGVKTDWSAPAIVFAGAIPFATCLVIGALCCSCGKRHTRPDA